MTTDLALSQLRAYERRIGGLDTEWKTPTALTDWDVTDLTRHVVAVAWMQAEAFHRARAGVAERPSWIELSTDPADLPHALAESRRHLESALSSVNLEADPVVPLPFAPMPASIAVPVLVLEYGYHLYDLQAALGDTAKVDREVAEVTLGLLPLWMPIAGTPTEEGTSVAVGDVALRYDGTGWQPTTEPACTIDGDPEARTLFALGRIRADDPRLTVTGDASIASRFKELFPGP